jgi:hypothetical protein
MPFIVLFIFGAVIVGAGAMLAPAWPTKQPRIGLNAALSLALVMGGALFWAYLFGWETLVVDYLLFALVTSIFLFGTLSYGQLRAEKRGEELLDRDQGWPGPNDLLLFAFALLLVVIPALIIPVPLDTDAQGFGYLGLMVRLGGTFDTLAPFQPEVTYLYAPGFSALLAYLSRQLGQPMHAVQLGVGAVLALMLVLLAFDLGAEVRDKRLGRATALAMLGGIGLLTAYMDSHYTTLLALNFALAFVIFSYRFLVHGFTADAIGAGLMLGATVLAHPDTTIILALGYVPWLATMWLGKPRPTVRRWAILVVGVPLIALLAIAPWLIRTLPLLGSDIASPFTRSLDYLRVFITYHGPIVVFVVIGAAIGLRQRQTLAIMMVVWLIMAVDFSTTGIIETIFRPILGFVEKYDYPFSIAWHGPIIPYALLGGMGLLWVWDRIAEARFGALLHRAAPALLIGASAFVLIGGAFSQAVLEFSKGRIGFYGAFSSAADVAAMTWLRTNAPPDARILNHPGPHEADWVPVIAEREAVYFRPQPFFRGMEAVEAEQARMLAFWRDPADPANEALLREAGIGYVIVPQIVTDPSSFARMWRWNPATFTDHIEAVSSVEDAPYLELVFDEQGARVYQLSMPD